LLPGDFLSIGDRGSSIAHRLLFMFRANNRTSIDFTRVDESDFGAEPTGPHSNTRGR